MKNSFTAITLVTALFAGSASAMVTSAPLSSVVGLSGVGVNYTIDDGVAMLFGHVDSGIEAALAQSHIEKMEGVDKVINLITVN